MCAQREDERALGVGEVCKCMSTSLQSVFQHCSDKETDNHIIHFTCFVFIRRLFCTRIKTVSLYSVSVGFY